MQIAIIGTKEEIIEIMKYIGKMQITSNTERVLRAEFSSRIEERTQLQFDGMNQSIENASSR